jgi:hypothetical protein
VTGQDYFVNNNITFEVMAQIERDTKPGKVIWTNQSEYISTNEKNINHDIIAHLPYKSIQPTDEHNTLMLWCADRTVKRMAFIDNLPIVIDEIFNCSLVDKYSLIRIPHGCIWRGHEGIWIMTDKGHKNITKGKINITNLTSVIALI